MSTETQHPNPNHQVFVRTLGCKVNTFDSHALTNQFTKAGWSLAKSAADAKVTVINTCSVTAAADREARYLIRRFRRENPTGTIVVTGCYAQTDSALLVSMPEVDLVVPNQVKESLLDYVNAHLGDPTPNATKLPLNVEAVSANRQLHFKSSITLFDHPESTQTRAYLKIQDGCNGFCTYCLIPYARGASRSVPPRQVLSEVKRLLDSGTPEIVFTGIHIGDYGRDLSEESVEVGAGVGSETTDEPFVTLLKDIFDLPLMNRLRISSLEPAELTPPLLELLIQKSPQFCDHFHLPLQSGHDRILKLMRRSYDSETYFNTVQAARKAFPNAHFGADIIPGFPGESEEEFLATVEFIKKCGLTYLHVFPYSLRPNTAAARMPGHLDPTTIKTRAQILRQLSDDLESNFLHHSLGSTLEVLWENETDPDGRRLGTTRNYIKIAAPVDANVKAGSISHVKIKGFVGKKTLLGTVVRG